MPTTTDPVIQPHRWRRQADPHPNTPADLRHLATARDLTPGWTVLLTCAASYRLVPQTATPTGAIQLDGYLDDLDDHHASVRIWWLQPTALPHGAANRSTPAIATRYRLTPDDLAGLAGRPPTMWDGRTTETLKASARRAARAQRQQNEPPRWWSDLGAD
jgi:hypothetical protein